MLPFLYLTWLQYKYLLFNLVIKQNICYRIYDNLSCLFFRCSFLELTNLHGIIQQGFSNLNQLYTARTIGWISGRLQSNISKLYRCRIKIDPTVRDIRVVSLFEMFMIFLPFSSHLSLVATSYVYGIMWFNTDHRAYLARHCPMMSMDDYEVRNF